MPKATGHTPILGFINTVTIIGNLFTILNGCEFFLTKLIMNKKSDFTCTLDHNSLQL